MPLATGQTLSHYEIRGLLGAGGMGEVYRAFDPHLEREVAVKVLPPDLVRDDDRLARFEREARALAALNHPSIAQVYGFERTDGTCFIAMELVAGEDLAQRLERGPLPLEEALKLCARIADGLEAAHDIGVVHRDLKPGNVVLSERDWPKVLDFGLAARLERPGSGTPPVTSPPGALTGTGIAMGSPGYMSPEQARGKAFDRRTDLFALGCVLFECLTGSRAFGGETSADAIAALLEREPDWTRLPGSTPPRVLDLLRRCLAKDPERRQRDAGDAALELRLALDEHERSGGEDRGPRPAALVAVAGLLGLALGAAAATLWPGASTAGPGGQDRRVIHFGIELPRPLGVNERMMNELAVAPTGSPILFLGEQGDRVGLYAHDLERGSTRELEVSELPRGAIISPDGRSVAFIDEYDHLAVASLDGTGKRRVAKIAGNVGGMGAWLDDDSIVIPDYLGEKLLAYDLGGSQPVVVAECDERLLGFDSVAAVPGETWLLASGWAGDTIDDYEIVAVGPGIDGSELLIDHGSSPTPVGGRYLVFVRGAALMAVRFDFRERKPLGEALQVIEGVATDDWGGGAQFAVSRDGSTLVYAPGKRRGEGRRLVWAGCDGSLEPILGEDAYVGGVELSRDGRRLLFNTLRHRRELWCLDFDGGLVSPVPAEGETYRAVFGPDGRSVYFRAVENGQPSLRHAVVGSGASRVLTQDRVSPSHVSADGSRIYLDRLSDFDSKDGDIVVLDLEDVSAPPVPLLDDEHDDFGAVVSPDGNWIAYGSTRAGRAQIYLRTIGGEREWRVCDAGWAPRWAPDGESLYYVHELDLVRVRLDLDPSIPRAILGQREVCLSSLTFAAEENFGIGPDGRVAMLELAEWERATDGLRVVTGWLAELDRLFASR